MTLEWIQARLDRIRLESQRDPEAAHILEDVLFTDVLTAIDRREAGPEHASLALSALNFAIPRWGA